MDDIYACGNNECRLKYSDNCQAPNLINRQGSLFNFLRSCHLRTVVLHVLVLCLLLNSVPAGHLTHYEDKTLPNFVRVPPNLCCWCYRAHHRPQLIFKTSAVTWEQCWGFAGAIIISLHVSLSFYTGISIFGKLSSRFSTVRMGLTLVLLLFLI